MNASSEVIRKSQDVVRFYRASESNVLIEKKLTFFTVVIMYSTITKRQYKIYRCRLCNSVFMSSTDALAHEEYEEEKFSRMKGVMV